MKFYGKAQYKGISSAQRSMMVPFETECFVFEINGVRTKYFHLNKEGTRVAPINGEWPKDNAWYDISCTLTEYNTMQRVKLITAPIMDVANL
jgi:hypothetical protein